jgi:flagellar hook-basal body complex protein FliE
MELSALSNVDLINAFQVPTISSSLGGDETTSVSSSNGAFESLFNSAANMISEANDYSNAAEEEEIKYSLGETESIHDLQIAQQKANISLQYVVAVRDSFMSGYKELMNLQF